MRLTFGLPARLPVQDIAFPFGSALVTMFYGPGLLYQLKGLLGLAACFLAPSTVKKSKQA